MGEGEPRGRERRRLLAADLGAGGPSARATSALAPVALAGEPRGSWRVSSISCYSYASAARAARLAATATLPFTSATREAPPTRTLRCVTRPGWGRMEGERRPAGAGLGGDTSASAMAIAAGQPRMRQAAPFTATGGSGGERSRKWWVLRGPPDVRSRLHMTLLLTLLEWGFDPGRRREEPSSTLI